MKEEASFAFSVSALNDPTRVVSADAALGQRTARRPLVSRWSAATLDGVTFLRAVVDPKKWSFTDLAYKIDNIKYKIDRSVLF